MPDSADAALADLLETLGLSHLRAALSSSTLSSLGQLERAALLSRLKSLGVERLAERQKLATAVAKAARAPAASTSDAVPAVNFDHLTPQSFQIFCHNTTLADGTTLDNTGPAPEFVIESVSVMWRAHAAVGAAAARSRAGFGSRRFTAGNAHGREATR